MIFYIIIAIVLIEFFISRFLDSLNASWRKKELPDMLKDIYKPEEYEKSQEYGRVKTKFSMISSGFQLVIILIVLFTGVFGLVDNFIHSHFENNIIAALLFFGAIFFASDIISLPFSIYSTFVIEEKFGFNKTTVKTFILDKIKGYFLALIIGGGLLALIIWFYYKTTSMFWIYAWILVSGFSVFMAMFYSSLIVPLFNKQTPLEEGELRDKIHEFSIKTGFRLDNIFVIDGSKRSSKANAYFTGLWNKKRIVLFDTIIKDLSVNEIVAVLAHEIGHYRLKHTRTSILLSIFQTGAIFYLLSLFIGNPALSNALGGNTPTFELGIIAFGLLFSPVSEAIGLIMNWVSRKNEYEADSFAKQQGQGEHLISSLKKLSVNNLSNLTPHPAYVFAYYSHPTLYQRIVAITSMSNIQNK
ncbi:MAG: M48 family metallopeptidase [Bacteroidales bacterium]